MNLVVSMKSSSRLAMLLAAGDRIVRDEFQRTGGVSQRGAIVLRHRMVTLPLEWHDDTSKLVAIRLFKDRVEREGAESYLIFGEAWMAPWATSSDQLLPASKSDRRMEVVYAFAADRSGANLLGLRQIEPLSVSASPKRTLGKLRIEADMEGFLA